MMMDRAHRPADTTPFQSVVGRVLAEQGRGGALSVERLCAPPPAVGVHQFERRSSEIADLGSLVQRPQLLKARPPIPKCLLPPRLPPAIH